jgi:hypothetical protein
MPTSLTWSLLVTLTDQSSVCIFHVPQCIIIRMSEILKFAFKILCTKLHIPATELPAWLGASLKQSRNATISLACPSFRLPVRMDRHNSNWTDCREISYWAVLIQAVDVFRCWLKSDKSRPNWRRTWRPAYIYENISPFAVFITETDWFLSEVQTEAKVNVDVRNVVIEHKYDFSFPRCLLQSVLYLLLSVYLSVCLCI